MPGQLRPAWLALALALATSGCAQLAYYGQAAHGHWEMMRSAKPTDQVIADPATGPKLKLKLQTAMQIRQFAIDELALPDNRSYRSYAQLDRPYALWNVLATPALSLTPMRWCFFVAGCTNYRGYYRQQDAQDFAVKLRSEGYDVRVDGVPAYSTLGWFSDPLLSTFIYSSDAMLAKLIFHELAHQLIYVKDDSAFNESFATSVEQAGVQRWLALYGDDKMRSAFQTAESRQADFLALLRRYRQQLVELYAQQAADSEKLVRKQAIFAALKMSYQELKQRWGGYAGYDHWFDQPVNNANFVSLATYYDLLPGFNALLDASGSFPAFYDAVRVLATLDRAERTRRLRQWQQQKNTQEKNGQHNPS